MPHTGAGPRPEGPTERRATHGSGPETRPVRHPVKSSFLDHSLLWVLTTDRRPTGLGCGGGFICDSLSIKESSEHPMGTRHGINSLLPRVGVACPQVHFLEAPEPLLCPNASVERAQPALRLLLGADVLNMVPGWGTLSCRDPHGHLKHLLEKLQKTEAHVRTDNTAGQDGATQASVWWARGQYAAWTRSPNPQPPEERAATVFPVYTWEN